MRVDIFFALVQGKRPLVETIDDKRNDEEEGR